MEKQVSVIVSDNAANISAAIEQLNYVNLRFAFIVCIFLIDKLH
jgi:hypothetical protein